MRTKVRAHKRKTRRGQTMVRNHVRMKSRRPSSRSKFRPVYDPLDLFKDVPLSKGEGQFMRFEDKTLSELERSGGGQRFSEKEREHREKVDFLKKMGHGKVIKENLGVWPFSKKEGFIPLSLYGEELKFSEEEKKMLGIKKHRGSGVRIVQFQPGKKGRYVTDELGMPVELEYISQAESFIDRRLGGSKKFRPVRLKK